MLRPLFVVLNLSLALGISIPRQEPCSFVMTAVGDTQGQVREDRIGEARIGGNYPQGEYYMIGNKLYDFQHRNCGLYPGSLQLGCSQGIVGDTNFVLGDDGNLLHDECPNFLACPAAGPGNDGSFNIYSDLKADTTGCHTVTLKTGGFNCSALGRPDSSSAAATPTLTATGSGSVTSAVATKAAATCPTNIASGTFQFPHLIVPTSPQKPDQAFGNSLKAWISAANTTLFNFDIPTTAPYTGTCSLVFLFPYGNELDPDVEKFYFSGQEQEVYQHGGIDFALLSGIADEGTAFSSTPAIATDYGKTEVIPGNNYTIATFDCPAGKRITYSASSVNKTELDYFQDSRPRPIGLYIVPCV